MAGFGREPFGHHPFGASDFGKDTVSRVYPKTTLQFDTNNLLLHYLRTTENSMNARKQEVDSMIDLVDPDRIRVDILGKLGAMIGQNIDENEGEEFQRTLVRDAVQFYQVKGTEKAFEIRGKISGFDVDVFRIWRVDESYLVHIPSANILEFPPGSGTVSGIWYTDLGPDQVSGVSAFVPINGDCTYCLTSFIKVGYTLVKTPTGPVVGNVLDRVIEKIKDVLPIHVRDVFIDLSVTICIETTNDVNLCIEEDFTFDIFAVNRHDTVFCADSGYLHDDHIPTVWNGDVF